MLPFLGSCLSPHLRETPGRGGLRKASRVGSHAPQMCGRSPGAPCPPLCSQRPRAGAAHPNPKDKTLVFARTQTSLTCSLPSPIPGPAPHLFCPRGCSLSVGDDSGHRGSATDLRRQPGAGTCRVLCRSHHTPWEPERLWLESSQTQPRGPKPL